MKQYEAFAVGLVTNQGYPLAVGGICLPGYAAAWRWKFSQLADLVIEDHSLYGIDCTLADALTNLSDESLLIVGASLDTGDSFGIEERTGGVLGSPQRKAQSAERDVDELPNGFQLWTAPGGPGIAVQGREADLETFLNNVGLLDGKHPEPLTVFRELKQVGLETGLLVLDGTGASASVFLMAFAAGKTEYVELDWGKSDAKRRVAVLSKTILWPGEAKERSI